MAAEITRQPVTAGYDSELPPAATRKTDMTTGAGPLPPRRQSCDRDRGLLGPGRGIRQGAAGAGADLVLAGRRAERLEATRAIVEQAGGRAIAAAADAALPESALAVVEAAITEFGHVDVLVNNAGKGTAVPPTRETPEQFREVIDINLNGCGLTYRMTCIILM